MHLVDLKRASHHLSAVHFLMYQNLTSSGKHGATSPSDLMDIILKEPKNCISSSTSNRRVQVANICVWK
jgi:hypothetical protein